jgi:NADH:ubiquinone oxidoreductase subunit 4 (subunit M)
VFYGTKNTDWKMNDLTIREKMIAVSLVIVIAGLGFFPQPVFDIAKPALRKTLEEHIDKTILTGQTVNIETELKSNLFLYK